MRRSMRWLLVLVVLGAASLFLLPGAGAQQTHQVDVTDEAFVPEQITVDSGDTVTWVADLSNQGRHNLIWDIGTWGMWDWVPGRADPYSITFSGAGTYTYHCDFVSSMQGSVVVEAVVPGAPEDVAAVAGVGAATVSWSRPVFIGGSVLTEYVVTASPGGASVSVPAEVTSTTIEGLEAGTAHVLEVVAVNAVGAGPAATSQAVTPIAPDPDPSPTPSPSPDPDPDPSPTPSPSPDPDPDAGPCPEEVAPAVFTDRDAIPSTHRGSVDCASSLAVVTGFGAPG